MNAIDKKGLLGMLIFLVVSGVLGGIMYSAYRDPWDRNLRRFLEERRAIMRDRQASQPVVDKGNISLEPGRPAAIGGLQLEFLGLDLKRRELWLAVTILELDPEVAYHHRIPLAQARRGIRLGGRDFVFISGSPSRILLGLRGMAAAIQ